MTRATSPGTSPSTSPGTPAPRRILVVDDDAALLDGMRETLADFGHDALTAASGEAALDLLLRERVDAVLLDLRLGGMDGLAVLARLRARPHAPPVAVLTAHASAANTIEAMRLGAADHLTKPVGRADLAALLERMLPDVPALRAPDRTGLGRGRDAEPRAAMVGVSAAMRDLQKTIGLLADGDATVLLTGETGTGKEVVARAIHRHGRRARQAFVAVNCANADARALDAELFGTPRAAGATERRGAFLDADRGTLFLDEVGDMNPDTQARLLRVLEDRAVPPPGGGGGRGLPCDARVIAATHRDLDAMARRGDFRADLLYRLRVVPLAVPPLRDRRDDILPLAAHFLALAAPDRAIGIAPDAARWLETREWPGNARELHSAMRRFATLSRGGTVTLRDLAGGRAEPTAPPAGDSGGGTLAEATARLEREMIRQALAATGNNRSEAARRLGIHRQLLHAKMRRHGLAPVRDPDGD